LALAALGRTHLAWAQPRFDRFPFTLGVASGEPTPDGFVLWTRLAPDPMNGGGMPPLAVEVSWEVAADEGMRAVVRSGRTLALPEWAHAVHVDVEELAPGRWYWYRFHVGDAHSPVGRTRTAPARGAPVDRLRFAFASCQNYEVGYFTALKRLAEEDVEVVFHLGDYIYESGQTPGRVRMHALPEVTTLDGYRNRYAEYKLDPDLQAAHAAFPWIATWDDHEVDNNYAAAVSERRDPVDAFLIRRGAAYQAYYEHLPLRRWSMPTGSTTQLYRSGAWGTLMSYFVLDTRQYRTVQPCGDGMQAQCVAALDHAGTMLGADQERWLLDGLDRSTGRWNVIPQQVMLARVDWDEGPDERFPMDHWSGYEASRTRLLRFFAERRPSNPVVLTGDVHTNWVNDLKVDFRRESSPVVATELVGTSLSSGGDGDDEPGNYHAIRRENPFVKFYNNQRGYVRCEVTADRLLADYRVLDFVTERGAPIRTRASFVIENGRPGARQA
jgi:alkaline phosphatase D